MLIVANGVNTFFEGSDGFIIEPGSPQFCYLIVDIIAPCWELIFGVKVMISQSSIDFSAWRKRRIIKIYIYVKVLSKLLIFSRPLASRASEEGEEEKPTNEENTEMS